MKPNIVIDRKTTILIGAVVLAGIILFALIAPLWSKASSVTQKARTLDNELSAVRDALKRGGSLKEDRHPLSRGEVSLAINEIMEVGASLDIDFFTTSPQRIEKSENSNYPVLPIQLELKSTYENFGIFLGALESLDKSIVTVRNFDISRDQMILPKIHVGLVLDLYLKEGEGG